MKNTLKQLSPFEKKNDCLNVVVETPKGNRVKYSYDQDTGLIRVTERMTFPFIFGFIPSTEAEDGDPLDILILNEEPLYPGSLLRATLGGVIEARQGEIGKFVRNDRLFGFALRKETPTSLESMGIGKKTLAEIEYFFKSYNKLSVKKFQILGKPVPNKALAIVKNAAKSHVNGHSPGSNGVDSQN